MMAVMAALALAVLHVGSQLAGAAASAVPTPVPMATVDLGRLLEQLDEKLAREKELQAIVDTLQADVSAKGKQVEAADKDLAAAPPDQQEKFAIELLKRGADAKLSKEIAERQIARRTRSFQLDLFNKIKTASAQYARQNGYAIVLSDDSGLEIPDGLSGPALQGAILGQRLIYIDPSAVDITDAVANQMNAAFRSQGRTP
jgi:Skp family chaperone for outer membrane proteins